MDRKAEDLRSRAEAHGQGHIFRWWNELDEVWRGYLLGQVAGLDFAELGALVEKHVLHPQTPDFGELTPAEPIAMPDGPDADTERRRAVAIGEDAVRSGNVAALVVAGGLGTRLRYVPPKGTFPAAPVTGKTLFQLHADKLRAWGRRCGVRIPWYIMTSEATDAPTRAYFAEHNYLGLPREDVSFFEQALSPAVDFRGKLLLAEKGAVAMSPNGHGGVLAALGGCSLGGRSALADMRRRGIKVISYFQVDNPLIKLIDPAFIGYHVERASEFSSKALPKRDADEGLGVFCSKDGNLHVIEYSHLPDRYKYARNERDELVFLAGSIAIHAISVEFFERLLAQGVRLPYHPAVKRVKCVDDQGRHTDPEKPNGVRFESFIFDAIPHARNTMVLMVDRAAEFSPIKQKDGPDSPATARQAQFNLFGRWLEQAGVGVPRDANGDVTVPIEISPLYALDAEELRARLAAEGRLRAGTRLTAELNLQPMP